MKLTVQGQGAVNLGQNQLLGSGGEGDVYVLGQTAYKIYHDPAKMIPTGKISELAGISDPDVIKPEWVLLNGSRPVGYTMRYVPKAYTLCQLFPPVFRNRNGITPAMTTLLVQYLRERVASVHKAGVLVVDLNEMNYLVGDTFDSIYAIDVDSYQTPHYPATAIMPSTQDPQVQGLDFTQVSDWFSFAIVSFNLFVGIHPYKGKHPTIHGFEDRMKAGVSVFNPNVSYPKVVLPFTVIPPAYLQWYKAVLEGGKRLPPPVDMQGGTLVILIPSVAGKTTNIHIQPLFKLGEPILHTWDHPEGTIIWTSTGVRLDTRTLLSEKRHVQGIGFTNMSRPVAVSVDPGQSLVLFDLFNKKDIPITLHADGVMAQAGRIYVKSRDKILEVRLTDSGSGVLASSKVVSTCLEHACKLYRGVALQAVFGTTWATLFPEAGKTYRVHLAELDRQRVIEARYENKGLSGVLMVVATKGLGVYNRYVFRFDSEFKTYDCRKIAGITPTGLNFVVLDSGVCVSLTEEEKLEVFSTSKGSSTVKVVEDPALGSDMVLGTRGGKVIFWRGDAINQMQMR